MKTLQAYKLLFENSWTFYILGSFLLICLFFISFFIPKIELDTQDSILSIVSILFPLIAGFLTFGRDVIFSLNKKIEAINLIHQKQSGRPTTDEEKRQIANLKNLASNFKNIVISSFIISFILIIFVLLSKLNKFEFQCHLDLFNTSTEHFFEFFKENSFQYFMKSIFLGTLIILLFNLCYLVYFIVQVNYADENILKEDKA